MNNKFLYFGLIIFLSFAMLCGTLLYLGNTFISRFTVKDFSPNIQTVTDDGNTDDLMSSYMVASYLHIDHQVLMQMVEDGKMEGCYFSLPDSSIIFIQEKLYQWAIEQASRQ